MDWSDTRQIHSCCLWGERRENGLGWGSKGIQLYIFILFNLNRLSKTLFLFFLNCSKCDEYYIFNLGGMYEGLNITLGPSLIFYQSNGIYG